MPLIHRLSEIELRENKSPIPDFSWKASLPLEEISKSKGCGSFATCLTTVFCSHNISHFFCRDYFITLR